MREKLRNAARRSSGAPYQTSPTIVASPPIQIDAAAMCTQSAIAVFHDEPGSSASWPDHDSPPAKSSASTNAGKSSSLRSSSHER